MTRLVSPQAPRAVVMIRPHFFEPNPETAADNAFQTHERAVSSGELAKLAYEEVSRMAEQLQEAGIRVHLFEDRTRATPDSVFPNNWFSTHAGGHIALYPMYAANRQLERRFDIIEHLKRTYRVQDVLDYSGLEYDGVYLEGTGAMVLDHLHRVAYAARSNRSNPVALERFCTHFNFEPIMFDAVDGAGSPVYHTNVLMCIGSEFVLIALEMIVDPIRRAEIARRLGETGREMIALSRSQISDFAGNAIELEGREGRLLVLSARAMRSLNPEQIVQIRRSTEILPLEVKTIELAGGSVRCMLAGIHLAERDTALYSKL